MIADVPGPHPSVFRVHRGMTFARPCAWPLMMALCLATSTALAASPRPMAQPAPPQSSKAALARERETLDSVVAASLVGALSEQLGDRPVKIKLKHVDVQVTSLRDRLVSGQGELQIDTCGMDRFAGAFWLQRADGSRIDGRIDGALNVDVDPAAGQP